MSIVNPDVLYWCAVDADQYREAICSNVARILREEREKRQLSMTVLAQRAGLSQAMISFIEREIRNPSLETLLRITAVLEIDLDEVVRRARHRASKECDRAPLP